MNFLDFIRQLLGYELIAVGENFKLKVYSLVLILLVFVGYKSTLFVIKKWLDHKVQEKELDVGNEYAIFAIVRYLLWTISILLSLQILGIDITLLLAGSTALLVGIGLGVQNVFMDFVSGIVLLLEGENKVNDIIEFDNKVGTIKRIGIRTSEIQTFNDTAIIVPNSKLINHYVINWSHINKVARYSIKVSVSYQSDARLVEKILIECAHAEDRVLKEPAPFVRIEDFGDNGIMFNLLFWTKDIFFADNLKSDIRFRILDRFKEHQIQIPYPQRVVTLHDRTLTPNDKTVTNNDNK